MTSVGKKLLIIDDDAVVRDSIAAYLSESGFILFHAGDGEQGLQVFHDHNPDIILCDLRMPVMDGLTVLRIVRKKSPDMPFIVISGAGVLSDVAEALRLGASDYITKPIMELEVLEYAIWRALNNARIIRENKQYKEALEEIICTLEKSLNLLQEDQKAGRQVQLNMLPESPRQFGDYRIDHHIIPSLFLSGDFVDYFPVSEHCFGFYLADVSGHGASSAFITVLLKHMSIHLLDEYRNRRRKDPIKPAQVLAYINRSLINTQLEKHVTLFGGIIDTQKHTLTFSFGGHFPFPIMAIKGKKPSFLEGKGVPLGLFEDAVYHDTIIDLPASFTLTILSDGILEVLTDKTLKEKEQHILSVINDGVDSASALTKQLKLSDTDDMPDDIAILVIKRG
ncbi:Regulator of RpoS [invertebrate metagenome]|uniref:Regulator of RpoS n=1 Tax=invertebrate metagenome TaxID=1711999 RepID=A0A2H9T5T1_9ZZZZ